MSKSNLPETLTKQPTVTAFTAGILGLFVVLITVGIRRRG